MVMCLKYRKLLLRQKDYIDSLRIIFQEIGERYWFEFDEIGTDGDHVHVFVGASPKWAPSRIMQVVKSISARQMFSEYPALATNYKHVTIGAVNTPWLLGTHFNHFSVIVPTPALTIGAYLSTWSMPDMDVRTEYYPEGTGEKFNASDFVIGLSVARSLTDHFGIGGSIKYIQERIWHSSSNSIALDFGSIFIIDIWNGVRIGAVLKNYGTEMRLKGRDMYHYHDPNEEIDGNDENIISGYITDSWMLPLLFKIGISTDIINSKRFKWVVEIDGKHPSNNYESLDCGTEFEINNMFFIRIGAEKIFLKDEEISFCSGFGIRLPILTKPCFDYAFKDYNDIGVIHSLALEFGF